MVVLKIFNVLENVIICLLCLWFGGKKEKKMKVSSLKVGKKVYSLCENILENFVFEESVQDFSYVEFGWNCLYFEDIELYYNFLVDLLMCFFELLVLKYLNVLFNDIQIFLFEMWIFFVLKLLDLKGNWVRKLLVMKIRCVRVGIGNSKILSLFCVKVLFFSKDNLLSDFR